MYNNQDDLSPEKFGNSTANYFNNTGKKHQKNRTLELRNRLYDKGFNQTTMPSVQRMGIKSLANSQDMSKSQKSQLYSQGLMEGSQQFQNRPKKVMRVKLSNYGQRSNKLEPIKYQK